MLLFIVSRENPVRYAELRHAFASQPDVDVILDRRQRTAEDHEPERRRVDREIGALGFSVIDTDEVLGAAVG